MSGTLSETRFWFARDTAFELSTLAVRLLQSIARLNITRTCLILEAYSVGMRLTHDVRILEDRPRSAINCTQNAVPNLQSIARCTDLLNNTIEPVRCTTSISTELDALRRYERTEPGRDIPDKSENHVMVATWNIANLGVQKRRTKDYRLIAEIVGWFDLIALQEVNDKLEGLRKIQEQLPGYYRVLFTDASGNSERFAFLYDSRKVRILEEVGEISIPVADEKKIALPTINAKFPGFDRTPFFATFRVEDGARAFEFLLATVHLYSGTRPSQEKTIPPRRSNGASSKRTRSRVGAIFRRKSKHAYTKHVMALGDFNLPRREAGDPVYDALVAKGIELPEHSDLVGGSGSERRQILRSDRIRARVEAKPSRRLRNV